MTKEEAIYVLTNTAWLGSAELAGDVTEAVKMAVNALKRSETPNSSESVQPDQEKPAKWIIYEVANCDGEPPIAWECPVCGEVVSCKYNFCPECGKPMDV